MTGENDVARVQARIREIMGVLDKDVHLQKQFRADPAGLLLAQGIPAEAAQQMAARVSGADDVSGYGLSDFIPENFWRNLMSDHPGLRSYGLEQSDL